MKNKMFGTLVAGAVAGLALSGAAVAKDAKKAKAKKDAKAPASAEWCKSNECKGSVTGAKNECKGKMACKGMTKENCEKDAKGTWTTEPAPK